MRPNWFANAELLRVSRFKNGPMTHEFMTLSHIGERRSPLIPQEIGARTPARAQRHSHSRLRRCQMFGRNGCATRCIQPACRRSCARGGKQGFFARWCHCASISFCRLASAAAISSNVGARHRYTSPREFRCRDYISVRRESDAVKDRAFASERDKLTPTFQIPDDNCLLVSITNGQPSAVGRECDRVPTAQPGDLAPVGRVPDLGVLGSAATGHGKELAICGKRNTGRFSCIQMRIHLASANYVTENAGTIAADCQTPAIVGRDGSQSDNRGPDISRDATSPTARRSPGPRRAADRCLFP